MTKPQRSYSRRASGVHAKHPQRHLLGAALQSESATAAFDQCPADAAALRRRGDGQSVDLQHVRV